MYRAGAVGAGIRSRVIGAGGEADGFRPIVHPMSMARGREVPMAGRQLPTGVGAATMAGGKDSMAGGVVMAMAMGMAGSIRSARMRSPGYLGPGLHHCRVSAIGR